MDRIKTLLIILFGVLCLGTTLNTDYTSTARVELGNLVGDEDSTPPAAGTPVLAFSDIVSGPDTGLSDGSGVGAIVTIWGFNLGGSQGSSTVEFCDSVPTCRDAAHVYYWKNADGTLPGGPANLYESHNMQEIAFSLPDGASGAGTIKVTTTGGTSNTLPFTVRTGTILWVHSTGDNDNSCTYASPCAHVNGNINPSEASTTNGLGNNRLSAGDIVYSRGVAEPAYSAGGVEAGMYFRTTAGTQSNPVAIIAYPNTRPTVSAGNRGVDLFKSDAIIISKYDIEVGHITTSTPTTDSSNPGPSNKSNQHIEAGQWGRAVGNHMTQISGMCFTGWSGSIVSVGDGGNDYKIFGNHFEELGCPNSSRFQHTLYMSIRNENVTTITPWEIGYNYLDNNDVFFGIHNYDETFSGDCGDFGSGTMKIHNNVIINQSGAGINVATNDKSSPENACWTMDLEIYNNVLINVGLGPIREDNVANAQAIRVTGEMGGSSLIIRNNTFYGYSDSDSRSVSTHEAIEVEYQFSNPTITIENNAFYQTCDCDWLTTTETLTTNKNSFWSSTTGDANTPPSWTGNITTDPTITQTGSQLSLDGGSPLIDAGVTAHTTTDIYGQARGTSIGAVED